MNRRSFISKSSLAMIAAAGLPKAIMSANTAPNATPATYKTKLEYGITNQTYYELLIDHKCITDLENATDEEKKIVLKVAYFETTDITTPTKGAEFHYNVKDSKLIDVDNSIRRIKTKLDKKVSGDYKLPKAFPKNLILEGKSYSSFKIIGKDDETLVEVPYYTPPSTGTGSGAGCFLTTACVQYKQLADDCDELNTLRFLREKHMRNNTEGLSLIDHYQILGPQIVNAIDGFANKAVIYDYMYQHMIQPSVELIKEEKLAEAVDHYKIFVKALAEKYL